MSIPEAQPQVDALGIDLGLSKYLTTSDKEFIALTSILDIFVPQAGIAATQVCQNEKGF
jgi:putative transposase